MISNEESITNVKNSVGPGFAPANKDNPEVLNTLPTSVYRVTGMNQIQDIINCGYVRTKGYGIREKKVGEKIYWSQGNTNLHYYDGRPVIEASIEKVKNEQIGAIPLTDLTAIWMFDEQQKKYINKLEQIKQLHTEKQQELANQPTNISLEQLTPILSESGYMWIGHGTGRMGNSDEVVDAIFKKGLRTKDNSLYYTSIVLSTPTPELIKQYEEIGLDAPTIESLRQQLNNWQHQDSKKIIIARIPTEYVNMMGDRSDLDGEMFGAFMNEEQQENGKTTYYLDSRFIIGCYDVDTQTVRLNKAFEKTLSQRTIKQLNEGYNKAVARTNKRLESATVMPIVGQLDENILQQDISSNLPNFDFDEQIEWDIPEESKGKSR